MYLANVPWDLKKDWKSVQFTTTATQAKSNSWIAIFLLGVVKTSPLDYLYGEVMLNCHFFTWKILPISVFNHVWLSSEVFGGWTRDTLLETYKPYIIVKRVQ